MDSKFYWPKTPKRKSLFLLPRFFLITILLAGIFFAFFSPQNRILIAFLFVYFLPTLINVYKIESPKKIFTFFMNLLGGWTIVLWMHLLIDNISPYNNKEIPRSEPELNHLSVAKIILKHVKKIKDQYFFTGEAIAEELIGSALESYGNFYHKIETPFVFLRDTPSKGAIFTDYGIYVNQNFIGAWRCNYADIKSLVLFERKIVINESFAIKLPSKTSDDNAKAIFEILVAIAELKA